MKYYIEYINEDFLPRPRYLRWYYVRGLRNKFDWGGSDDIDKKKIGSLKEIRLIISLGIKKSLNFHKKTVHSIKIVPIYDT